MSNKKGSFTFPVVSFRHLENPFQKKGFRDYFAVIDSKDLPDLSAWRKINVRDPKLTGSIPRAIRSSIHDNPDLFLFMNRGIVLSVASIQLDNKNSVLTVTLTDPNIHGLLDGGHSYNIIVEETVNLTEPQYIKVELLEGFDLEAITQIVDARNTSNQVRDESLMNLAGEFDKLKKALEGAAYLPQIAFKEFELDNNDKPKPIDVREIVAIMTAFDKDHFTETNHPVNTYRSKASCLKHFKDNPESYRKIYPLVKEILELYDYIQLKLPMLYNKARGQAGDVSGGKFGKLTGVTYYGENKQYLYFLQKNSPYAVPLGFVYPILGAFRALLEEKKGRYVWGKGLDPFKLLVDDLGITLANTIGNFALEHQNPSKTGKSPSVWEACYTRVENTYLRKTA